VCHGAVVGMPAFDVKAKRNARISGHERCSERRGEAIGRLEGAQGVNGIEELGMRFGPGSGPRTALQLIEALLESNQSRIVGEGDDHL